MDSPCDADEGSLVLVVDALDLMVHSPICARHLFCPVHGHSLQLKLSLTLILLWIDPSGASARSARQFLARSVPA